MQEQELFKNKLQILDKRLNAFSQGYRQNIAILGEDSDEITYLLDNYFSSNKIKEIIHIRTSVAHLDRRSFFRSILFSLLSEYLNKEDSLDSLINYSQEMLPLTLNFAKDVIKRTNPPFFFEALELINKFINETSKRCVFIVENFLKLKDIFPTCHQDFSKFIILQNNCMVILSDVDTKESEKTLYSELNCLFGNFEKIAIDESNFISRFMQVRKTFDEIPCSPFFVSFFVNILGSNTIYYTLMKEYVRQSYRNEDESRSITAALTGALYLKETYFSQRFISKINKIEENFRDSAALIKLLIAISDGYIRERELISLRIFDSKNLKAKLQKLYDLNYVENLGAVYRIKDPLFSFWVSHVFKMLFSAPVFDSQKRLSLFRRKMEETVSLFRDDFYKDKIKKVLELFGSFRNDTLRLGKDRYKLPLLEKSRLMSYPDKKTHLLIGEGREVLFVAIKEEEANDNDIFDFLEKGSSLKGKNVKKIFVSLDDFTSSARLIAKNNKLIAWGINEMNDLCRAYNRPIICAENKRVEAVNSENTGNF
ncbi:MAG: hypothetical protein PHP17_02920 [Candidatus Omnitrophica bacterium]|nr:hypothetical protein [Candidatus Omnitrophota bacterium]